MEVRDGDGGQRQVGDGKDGDGHEQERDRALGLADSRVAPEAPPGYNQGEAEPGRQAQRGLMLPGETNKVEPLRPRTTASSGGHKMRPPSRPPTSPDLHPPTAAVASTPSTERRKGQIFVIALCLHCHNAAVADFEGERPAAGHIRVQLRTAAALSAITLRASSTNCRTRGSATR
jgi:hypothetical protein